MHMQRASKGEKLQTKLDHLLFAIVVYGGLASAAAFALL